MGSFIKVEGIFHSALFTIHVVDEIHFFTKKQRYSVDKERYTDIYILNLLFDIYIWSFGELKMADHKIHDEALSKLWIVCGDIYTQKLIHILKTWKLYLD